MTFNVSKIILKMLIVFFIIAHLLSDNSNFLRLGNLGKFFNVVKPTFIRLSFSNAVNSSVKPSIELLRQLSKLSSLIYNKNNIKTTH